MNTAHGRIENIPMEFEDALLFAVTPDNTSVGVKIFPNKDPPSEYSHIKLENYIDQSVERAIQLKSSVESGRCDIERNRQIVLNPITKFTDAESLARSRSKAIEQIRLIEVENRFIDLGKIIIQSIQTGTDPLFPELVKCVICLGEMFVLSRQMLTSLMLKKSPNIVHGVSNLCHYYPDTKQPAVVIKCSKIRQYANKTLGGFKVVMGFQNGSNEQFLQWFNESVKLFRELTAKITEDERRQLTIDPVNSLTSRIVA